MKTHCKFWNLTSFWSHIVCLLIYNSCQQILFLTQPTRIWYQSTPNDDWMSMKAIKIKTLCKIWNLTSFWCHIVLLLIYPSCQQISILIQPTRIQSTKNDDCISMKPIKMKIHCKFILFDFFVISHTPPVDISLLLGNLIFDAEYPNLVSKHTYWWFYVYEINKNENTLLNLEFDILAISKSPPVDIS